MVIHQKLVTFQSGICLHLNSGIGLQILVHITYKKKPTFHDLYTKHIHLLCFFQDNFLAQPEGSPYNMGQDHLRPLYGKQIQFPKIYGSQKENINKSE